MFLPKIKRIVEYEGWWCYAHRHMLISTIRLTAITKIKSLCPMEVKPSFAGIGSFSMIIVSCIVSTFPELSKISKIDIHISMNYRIYFINNAQLKWSSVFLNISSTKPLYWLAKGWYPASQVCELNRLYTAEGAWEWIFLLKIHNLYRWMLKIGVCI